MLLDRSQQKVLVYLGDRREYGDIVEHYLSDAAYYGALSRLRSRGLVERRTYELTPAGAAEYRQILSRVRRESKAKRSASGHFYYVNPEARREVLEMLADCCNGQDPEVQEAFRVAIAELERAARTKPKSRKPKRKKRGT